MRSVLLASNRETKTQKKKGEKENNTKLKCSSQVDSVSQGEEREGVTSGKIITTKNSSEFVASVMFQLL